MFPMVAPAEHISDVIVQVLDSLLIKGGHLLQGSFVPRVLPGRFVEVSQCGLSQFKAGVALVFILAALLNAEPADDQRKR